MVIDYKGVSFSFSDQKKKRHVRRFRIGILVFIVIVLLLFTINWFDAVKVSSIQELLLENKPVEAFEELAGAESSFFHRKSKKELKGLACLFTGDFDGAGKIFDSMDGESSNVEYEKFLEYFSDKAQYRNMKIYTEYLVKGGESLDYYRVLYNTALFNPTESETLLGKMSLSDKEIYKKKLGIISRINKQLLSGKINYIFDVNGMPLAYYDLKAEKTVSLTPGIAFDDFTGEFRKSIRFYTLSLDSRMHKMLHRLFKREYGNFLLFNLNDTSIAAAYSKPVEDKWKGKNAVLSQRYEPGSIIKILTLFAYLRSDKQNLFPYDCRGTCPIEGKTFFDWFRHETIKNFEEALAVSCNISFARMGIQMGVKKLSGTFNSFFFNKGGFKDLFLEFETGKCNTQTAGNYELANLSVGLNQISITTFHAALIPAVIAQSGSIYSPYIIKNKKNLLDLGFYNHQGTLLTVAEDNAVFLKVKNAMVEVVENDRGTGRRSRVDFVQMALKTGTAGNKKVGLDAIIVGFFPIEKPKYAFAFRLERAGKAELKGAYFFKRFLTALYHEE